MNKSPQYNQQTEPKQCKCEVFRKYIFIKTWMETAAIAEHLHLKINSGCHDKENTFEQTMSESSQITELHETKNIKLCSLMLHTAKVFNIYDHHTYSLY